MNGVHPFQWMWMSPMYRVLILYRFAEMKGIVWES